MKNLLLTLLLLTLLTACSNNVEPSEQETPPEFNYASFSEVHLSHWDELSDVEDGLVILYYYSPYCDYCAMFEPTITEFSYLHRDTINLYFVNSSQIIDRGEPDFELFGVPALIILDDRAFVEMIRGLHNIEAYLNELVSLNE